MHLEGYLGKITKSHQRPRIKYKLTECIVYSSLMFMGLRFNCIPTVDEKISPPYFKEFDNENPRFI